MKIKRKIMRYAGMLVIKLQPKDDEDFGLKEGKEIDISPLIKNANN